MTFKIDWEENALNSLNKLDFLISKRIVNKIEELKENPFSKIKRLKGENVFSLRVGDYRVIIDMHAKNNLIRILKLGHRKNIYKRG